MVQPQILHLLSMGVPQGSLIGQPCFSININDMPDCTRWNLDQFADDSTAHIVGSSVDHVLTNIQKGENEIDNYSNKNLLTIHPDKCKVIIKNDLLIAWWISKLVGRALKLSNPQLFWELQLMMEWNGTTIAKKYQRCSVQSEGSKPFPDKGYANKVNIVNNLFSRHIACNTVLYFNLGKLFTNTGEQYWKISQMQFLQQDSSFASRN